MSLIRFRSVSKPWKFFIDSSEFITGYIARDTRPHRLLLRYKDNNIDELKYVSFVDGENDILTKQQEFNPNVPLLVKQLYMSKIIGSSYGFWCLHGYKNLCLHGVVNWPTEMLVLWNPSIRKSVGIVVPIVYAAPVMIFGFGVRPLTYDPTIVIMSYSYGNLGNKDMGKWQVNVFALSSKTWKMKPSSNTLRESIRVTSSTQVATNRFIFWVACDTIATNDGVSEYKNLMLSFDLITQEFKAVNLPRSLEKLRSLNFSISKLRESVVVSTYTDEVNGRVYGVWMMGEEGGVMASFTKLFNIKTPFSSLVSKVLGFTMSGEPIMETKNYYGQFAKVKVYKPCSEHINALDINGEDGSFFICPYTFLITQIVVSFPRILEGDDDGCGARSRAWNDVFSKLTIALMILRFTKANVSFTNK